MVDRPAWEQPTLGFLVLGYGKLGGLELGYGSDLDLVFLHGSDQPGDARPMGLNPSAPSSSMTASASA